MLFVYYPFSILLRDHFSCACCNANTLPFLYHYNFFLVHFNCIAFSSPLSHTIYYIVLFTTLLCCFNEQGRFVLVLCCCCVVFLFYTSHKIVHLFKLFFYISQPIYVYCIQTRQTDIYTHDTLTDTNNLTFTLPLSNLQCKTQ